MITARSIRRLICCASAVAAAAVLGACNCNSCESETAMLDADGNVILAADGSSCASSCSDSCSAECKAKCAESGCCGSCGGNKTVSDSDNTCDGEKKACCGSCGGSAAATCPVTGKVMTANTHDHDGHSHTHD